MSRTLETVILCPVCNEIFENGEDARLCCAPEAIGGQQCNQCLLLDNQCQCDFEPAPAGAQLH